MKRMENDEKSRKMEECDKRVREREKDTKKTVRMREVQEQKEDPLGSIKF